jgi:hypothetical protein
VFSGGLHLFSKETRRVRWGGRKINANEGEMKCVSDKVFVHAPRRVSNGAKRPVAL